MGPPEANLIQSSPEFLLRPCYVLSFELDGARVTDMEDGPSPQRAYGLQEHNC